MSTHNTHYATEQDKLIPSSGLTFFALCYQRSDGNTQWLTRDRRLTFYCESAARFSSFQDAKSYAGSDFLNGDCEIVVFCWSITSSCYFSSHSYTCLGGRSEWCAGHFDV